MVEIVMGKMGESLEVLGFLVTIEPNMHCHLAGIQTAVLYSIPLPLV